MNVPVRKPLVAAEKIRADPVAVFVARAEARATLWAAGEISLHAAVDELWADAMRDGLVAKLGTDEVQRLLADAFAPERTDLPRYEDVTPEPITDDDGFAEACRRADEKQRRKPPDPRLERLRWLIDDDVSIERAWHELNERAPGDVPTATLRTAKFLLQQNDPKRLKDWLARHSREARDAIRKHLSKKRGPSCQ
jgi:hypothetical protein